MIIEGYFFIILLLNKTICSDLSSELSHRDGQMRGHKIYFYAKLPNITPNYHQILLLIYSADCMRRS